MTPNFNARSYHLSKEANLVFGDADSVKAVLGRVEEFKKDCRPMSRAEAEQCRGIDYFLTWLMMQWAG